MGRTTMAQTSCPTVNASRSVGPASTVFPASPAAAAAAAAAASAPSSSPSSLSLSLAASAAFAGAPLERRRFLLAAFLLALRPPAAAFLKSSEACVDSRRCCQDRRLAARDMRSAGRLLYGGIPTNSGHNVSGARLVELDGPLEPRREGHGELLIAEIRDAAPQLHPNGDALRGGGNGDAAT